MTINTNYTMEITIDLTLEHINTDKLICQDFFW